MAAVLPVVKPASPKGLATERNGIMWEIFFIDELHRYTVIREVKTRREAKEFCDAHTGYGFRNTTAWRTM